MSKKKITSILLLILFCLGSQAALGRENQKEEKKNRYENAKTVEEVEKILEGVQKEASDEIKTVEQYAAFMKTLGTACVEASDKILDEIAKTVKDKELGYKYKIQGLKMLDQAEKLSGGMLQRLAPSKSQSRKDYEALVDELEKDGSYAELVNDERFNQFQERLQAMYGRMNEKQYGEFFEEAKKFVCLKPIGYDPARPLLRLLSAAEFGVLASGGKKLRVRELVDRMSEYVRSAECTLSEKEKTEAVDRLAGVARRCNGEKLELYGKTLDDKDFDWDALRGKIVLVKFTASWCGPCKAQVPGMMKAYDKYRDKGFEIVSVYVWDELSNVKKMVEEEKLPWIILSEELTKKAGEPEQGTFYTVQGVPTMLLIDREGNIIETKIDGDTLSAKLSKLLD